MMRTMPLDSRALEDFYDSRIGQVARRLIARRLGRELDIRPLRMMIPDAEDARLLREALARGLRRG